MTHFLDIRDLSRDTLLALLDEAARRKRARAGRPRAAADADAPLAGHALAMVFEKPSTRTRVSFDIAMRQLGGAPLVFNANDMQLGRGETVADTARVLSRMVDAIMIRTFAHATIEELAKHAAVPVINGLTDHSHPCQIMADLLTLREHGKAFQGLKVAWLGDVNNVTHSWIEAAALLGMHFVIAAPPGLKPHPDVMAFASAQPGAIEITHDAEKAAEGADCVITDTWVSMHEDEAKHRAALETFAPYQVNEALMAGAKPDAVFMHCLPAHRGEEVTDAVLDGPRSVVLDEAENRIHAQKAVLLWTLGALA